MSSPASAAQRRLSPGRVSCSWASSKVRNRRISDLEPGYGKLHPNHGDLLVNRAAVLAKAGRRTEALSECAAGLKILGDTLGAEAAFIKADTRLCEDPGRIPAAEVSVWSRSAPGQVAATRLR